MSKPKRRRTKKNRACRQKHRKDGKFSACMNEIRAFAEEEDAVSVVEIILILVVLVSLVVIFKSQLTSLVNNILNKITSQSESI